jgi:hypothetical protein
MRLKRLGGGNPPGPLRWTDWLKSHDWRSKRQRPRGGSLPQPGLGGEAKASEPSVVAIGQRRLPGLYREWAWRVSAAGYLETRDDHGDACFSTGDLSSRQGQTSFEGREAKHGCTKHLHPQTASQPWSRTPKCRRWSGAVHGTVTGMMLAGVWKLMEQAKGTVWSFQRRVAETEVGLESLEEPWT